MFFPEKWFIKYFETLFGDGIVPEKKKVEVAAKYDCC